MTLPGQAIGQNTPHCEAILAEAEEHYVFARFEASIEAVQLCVDRDDLSPEQTAHAYSLLGKNHQKLNQDEEAKQALRRLLREVPDYRPDPIQETPVFIALVEEVRREMQFMGDDPVEMDPAIVRATPLPQEEDRDEVQTSVEEENGSLGRWLLIGGGALVTGFTAAVLLTSGGGQGPGDGAWPTPPGRPRD